MDRSALFIDIEGFSTIYSNDTTRGLKPLMALVEAIYDAGCHVCSEFPNRLFAHQMADGFIIVSEVAERSPKFPVALGVYLLRRVLISGGVGKCSVSQGNFGDIKACYPATIRQNCDGNRVRLGRGIMTLFPYMGSALINAYKAHKITKLPGSLLIIDRALAASLTVGSNVTTATTDFSVVDWIHIDTQEITELDKKTKKDHPVPASLEQLLGQYIDTHRAELPELWVENTLMFNGLRTV